MGKIMRKLSYPFLVANAFGKDAPDVNGDRTVNVLDLVIVANAFE